MATYEQVTYNSPDGAQVGATSTEKVGHWGVVPVVQPTYTLTQTAVTTTLTVSTTPFGFTTSTQANDLVTQLNAARTDIIGIKSALSSAGLIL